MGARQYPVTRGQRWVLATAGHPTLGRPVQRVLRLRGALDTKALLRAVRAVVHANESLRLRLLRGAQARAQRFPELVPEIRGLSFMGREPLARRYAAAVDMLSLRGLAPFDLRKDPPFVAEVARLGPEHHLLALTVDHAAADELGLNLAIQQIERAYRAFQAGGGEDAAGLPPPGRFAGYLLQLEAKPEAEEPHLAYWLDQLQDVPAPPPLVRARRGAAGKEDDWVRGVRHVHHAPPALLEQARQARWSPFMALVAAQVLLLARLRDIREMVVNIPFSNRAQAAERELVANLSVLCHLRFRVDPSETVAELRLRVRQQVLEAMSHRDYDYQTLMARLPGGRRDSWSLGCNYVHEPEGGLEWFEPVDLNAGVVPAVPEGCFVLTVRHRQELQIEALFDPAMWPLRGPEFVQRLHALLRALHEPEGRQKVGELLRA
jgi:Condensation domain